MTWDLCLAPGCGAVIPDDSKPCPQCAGRGYHDRLFDGKRRKPWTNREWRQRMKEDEEAAAHV